MKKLLPTLLLLCLSQALTAQSDKLIDSLSKIYTNITYYKNTPFLKVTQKGKYGLSKPKTDSLYDEIDKYNEYRPFIAAKKNGFWGLIDSTGKEIGRWDYEEIYKDKNYYLFTIGNKKGVLNQKGKEIIPPIYDKIFETHFGFKVILNGKMGFTDYDGNVRIPIEYTSIAEIKESIKRDYLGIYKDSLVCIWNVKEFKQITDPIYLDIKYTKLGFFALKNGKYGMIDTLGNTLIPFENIAMYYNNKYNYLFMCKKKSAYPKNISHN